jgi:hypothetical protein
MQNLQHTINQTLTLTFETLVLSKKWKKVFKEENTGAAMIQGDLRTIEALKKLKEKIMLNSRFKNDKGEYFKVTAFVGLPADEGLLENVEVLDETRKVTNIVKQEYIRKALKDKKISWV